MLIQLSSVELASAPKLVQDWFLSHIFPTTCGPAASSVTTVTVEEPAAASTTVPKNAGKAKKEKEAKAVEPELDMFGEPIVADSSPEVEATEEACMIAAKAAVANGKNMVLALALKGVGAANVKAIPQDKRAAFLTALSLG